MNQHQKEQLQNLVKSLNSEHQIIRRGLLSDDYDFYQLFTEWQQAAILIGTKIELLEGEGTQPVKILEDYCETLYQYSLIVHNANDFTNSMIDHIDQLITQVYCLISEITTKLEIVFLPYNASMWDTFESIWRVAHKDPKCSCRVIPIPYFDKDNKGNFISMHYEGDEISKYVPIVYYEDYDIADNKPDIIYIHNPYDNYNIVTSVHPSYYSSELKKHTELLVYIPYFILGDRLPAHLAEVMGVFHADKVVAQSETIKIAYKEAYIRVLGEKEKEKEIKSGIVNQKFWETLDRIAEDKFLALGSPKVDKVIYHLENKPEMPEEWVSIIRKITGRCNNEDISDIKIILYNTSISNLLTYRTKGIEKIKAVIYYFREREDCVLLWRPHPLKTASMIAMTPDILEDYQNIVNEFKSKAYGIYDDSTDLHRAIALSDAYYGDAHSSVVQMYGATGKPILYQDMERTNIMSVNHKYAIGFEDFIIDGEYIWFADINMNGLYRMNTMSHETEFIARFPDELAISSRLYQGGVIQDDKLIFAPFKAKNGVIFDKSTKEFTSINILNTLENRRKDYEKFIGAVLYRDKVYMLPCLYPAIGQYRIMEKTMQYETDWVFELEQACSVSDDAYGRRFIIRDSRYIMMPLSNANAVLEYDMEMEKGNIYSLGQEGYSYSGICYDGSYYWLSPRHDGAVARWDMQNNNVTYYSEFLSWSEKSNYSFSDTVYCAGYVWMFPLMGNMVLKIDPKTGVFEKVDVFDTYISQLPNNKKFHLVRTDGEIIYALTPFQNTILIYNPNDNIIKEQFAYYPQITKDEEVIERFNYMVANQQKDFRKHNYIYRENINFSLNNFIQLCLLEKDELSDSRRKAFSELFTNFEGCSGVKIHNKMIKTVVNSYDKG